MFYVVELESNYRLQDVAFTCIVSLFMVYVSIVLFFSGYNERFEGSHNDTSLTYVNDKYACIKHMFTFHLICTWVTFLSGLFSIMTRLSFLAKFGAFHMWFGRAYIIGLLWTSATSSLIRNEGLPFGTLISFAWVLGCLTFGWIAISIFRECSIVNVNSVFNLPHLHGAFMFTSWFSIAGRIFNYSIHKDFTCYTYPALKSFKTNHSEVSFMDSMDPSYDKYPWSNKEVWGWGIPLLCGPIFSFFVVVYCISMRSR